MANRVKGWRDEKEIKEMYVYGGCREQHGAEELFFFLAATVTINSSVLLGSDMRCAREEREMDERGHLPPLSLSLPLFFLNEMRQADGKI